MIKSKVIYLANVQGHESMKNLAPINTNRQANQLPDEKCPCKIDLPRPGAARNILQQWLSDYPVHARKDHLAAKQNFEWLESRLSLRDSECSR
jgi:hypothetical protein